MIELFVLLWVALAFWTAGFLTSRWRASREVRDLEELRLQKHRGNMDHNGCHEVLVALALSQEEPLVVPYSAIRRVGPRHELAITDDFTRNALLITARETTPCPSTSP